MLYRVLQAHWKTFLADMEAAADPAALPAFVVSDMEAFRPPDLPQAPAHAAQSLA